VWDQTGRISLVVGPMNYDRFDDFLPTGTALAAFRDIARLYLGPEMEFTVQLVLRARQVPTAKLDAASGPKLGWTSWLTSARPRTHNPHVALTGKAS
jgi:type VI secretion system protein ImpH